MLKTKKRGQLAIFMILGLVILISFFLVFYFKSAAAKNKDDVVNTGKTSLDITPIKHYITTCLKEVSDEVLFEKIGKQGGYLNPEGIVDYILYDGSKVPYYLDGIAVNYPTKDAIAERISNYVLAELESCLKLDVFSEMGFEVAKPVSFEVNTSINKKDVSVRLEYPLTVKQGDQTTELLDFKVNLPVGLGDIYDSMETLIWYVKNNGQVPNPAYNIGAHCSLYDSNGLTNVYVKNKEIIQFMDFSTYEQDYLQTYKFQFAVKNVNVTGACVG